MKTNTLVMILLLPLSLQAGQVSSILDSDKNVSKDLVTEYIEWASPYIREYPPRFLSEDQEKRIFISTLMITSEIKKVVPEEIKDVDLLTDLAFIMSMGHNLDMGTAELSKKFFEVAIRRAPANRKANYLMGMFLASTSKYLYDSVPYLEKALALGEEDARFTLGLMAVNQGKKEEGLTMLRTYFTANPDNEHVMNIIKAIENEELEFKTSDSKIIEVEIEK